MRGYLFFKNQKPKKQDGNHASQIFSNHNGVMILADTPVRKRFPDVLFSIFFTIVAIIHLFVKINVTGE